jgi:hypothetical protein
MALRWNEEDEIVNKTAAFALLLLAAAASSPALAGTAFTLSGTVSRASCWAAPTYDGSKLLQCELAIAPDQGWAPETVVFCLDPAVAVACSSVEYGAPVLVLVEERRGFKVVHKIGLQAGRE